MWYKNGKFVLYLYEVSESSSIIGLDLPSLYAAARDGAPEGAEATSLHWVSLLELCSAIGMAPQSVVPASATAAVKGEAGVHVHAAAAAEAPPSVASVAAPSSRTSTLRTASSTEEAKATDAVGKLEESVQSMRLQPASSSPPSHLAGHRRHPTDGDRGRQCPPGTRGRRPAPRTVRDCQSGQPLKLGRFLVEMLQSSAFRALARSRVESEW